MYCWGADGIQICSTFPKMYIVVHLYKESMGGNLPGYCYFHIHTHTYTYVSIYMEIAISWQSNIFTWKWQLLLPTTGMFSRAFLIYTCIPGTFSNSVIEFKQPGLFQLSDTAFLVSSNFFIFYLKKRKFFFWKQYTIKITFNFHWGFKIPSLRSGCVQKLNTWKSPVAARNSQTCWTENVRILQLCHW